MKSGFIALTRRETFSSSTESTPKSPNATNCCGRLGSGSGIHMVGGGHLVDAIRTAADAKQEPRDQKRAQ